jgi:hypothetical protein
MFVREPVQGGAPGRLIEGYQGRSHARLPSKVPHTKNPARRPGDREYAFSRMPLLGMEIAAGVGPVCNTTPSFFSARGRLSLDTVVNARGKAGEPAQCPLKNKRAQRWARIGSRGRAVLDLPAAK